MNHPLSTLAKRRDIEAREFWLVDNLLPGGNLHMIVGGSGAGKTTWLFQILHQWSQGLPIAGHRSHPQPWVYISCDRGMQDTTQTLRRIGLQDWDCPVFAITDLLDLNNGINIQQILEHRAFQGIKVFIIDGLQFLLPDTRPGQSQNKVEMTWVAQLRAMYLEKGYTIIGITHRPKKNVTSGSDKQNTRTDALGSASLMACAGTIVKVEEAPQDADQEADQRMVHWNGKQFKEFAQLYDIDDKGRFVNERTHWIPGALSDEMLAQQQEEGNQFDLWLLSTPDEHFKTADIEAEIMQKFRVSRATVTRWIRSAVARGLLVKIDHGRYRKGFENLPS